MTADKASSTRDATAEVSRDHTEISDDISRIVGYLNTKRSNASDLTNGLAQNLSDRPERDPGRDQLAKLDRRVEAKREPGAVPSKSNPALAERYHAFCHDMDVMLDGFRARVDGDKPVKH